MKVYMVEHEMGDERNIKGVFSDLNFAKSALEKDGFDVKFSSSSPFGTFEASYINRYGISFKDDKVANDLYCSFDLMTMEYDFDYGVRRITACEFFDSKSVQEVDTVIEQFILMVKKDFDISVGVLFYGFETNIVAFSDTMTDDTLTMIQQKYMSHNFFGEYKDRISFLATKKCNIHSINCFNRLYI